MHNYVHKHNITYAGHIKLLFIVRFSHAGLQSLLEFHLVISKYCVILRVSSNRSEMMTIYSKKFFQNIVGDGQVWPSKFREKVILPILISLLLVSMQIATALNSCINTDGNIANTVTSFMVFLFMISWIPIYWHFLVNRQRIYSLMDDMNDLIDERV